ncbi:hypothetical protein SAMN05192588_2022 [Nonlabens sp. Hel1_33_55]|nr:hypothetical protein SAMN05192588_2022 [Nonlabens sp. Hel1_33_55]
MLALDSNSGSKHLFRFHCLKHEPYANSAKDFLFGIKGDSFMALQYTSCLEV